MYRLGRAPESLLPRNGLIRAAKQACLVTAWDASGMVVAKYYERLLHRHGKSPQSLAERTDDKARAFYQHLFYGVDLPPSLAVLDIGCGMGDLIDYLQSRDANIDRYLGIDLVGQFVDICRKEYLPPCRFQQVNFISPSFAPAETFNLIVNMGVMVSRVCWYEQYVAFSIEKMLSMASKHLLFNVITEADDSLGNYQSARRIGGITYLPRRRLTDLVERASRRVRADYHIHEVRIYPDAVDAFVRITVGG